MTEPKKLFRWLGLGLSILALIFLVEKLKGYSAQIDGFQIISLALPLIALSIAYAAANLALAFAWRNLLRHLGVTVSGRWATGVYGISQLAKYVPGNIFHFVGRQALGIQAGISSGPLAKSALWEIGLLATTGSMAILLVVPYLVSGSVALFTFTLFGLVVFSGVWLANRLSGRWIAVAMLWQIVFHCIAALIFLALLLFITPVPQPEFALVCGAYILAWLAGLLTPGSPAGIGIREVVLLALLQSTTSGVDLLLAISLSRLITVSGDISFYLYALKIRLPNNLAT